MKFFLAIFATCLLVSVARAANPQPAINYVEGEVIVTFKKSVNLAGATAALGRHSLSFQKHFDTISKKRGQHYGWIRARGRSTASLIAELGKDPAIESVEPNYIRRIFGALPNDALFPQQWGLQNTGEQFLNEDDSLTTGTPGDDIKFRGAWALAAPSTNEVVVGIVDTGIDTNHPDLAPNLWVNPYVAEDSGSYPGDLHGFDFVDNNANIFDSGFHGSHVSGIVAAVGNNSLGVIGVDFHAHLMVLKVSNDGETVNDAAIDAAIDYVAMMRERGVNIVSLNASYGGSESDSTEEAAIQTVGEDGVIFCAAAGNNGTDNDSAPVYPANYRLANMIVVAATDQNDQLASFSDYGPTTVDLAAPGVDILSTIPTNQSTVPIAGLNINGTSYFANALTYSGSSQGITGALIDCGLGYPTNFPPAVSNNIALISRGTLNFSVKVANAMAAGATAAVIYNNASGNYFGTLGSESNWIPAMSISQSDGQAIEAALPVSGFVYASPLYGFLDGTSMATPHVTAAVAFAAMNFPNETMAQRIQRILKNVDQVSSLTNLVATSGRLNLQRMVDTDGNGLPDWWEQMYFGHLTGTDPNADPDHDGASNLQEWQAGTDPVNSLSYPEVTATRTPGGPGLTWQGVNNRSYFLTRGTNAAGSLAFQTIVTNLIGQGGPATYIDTNAPPETQSFYRLGVGLDPFP